LLTLIHANTNCTKTAYRLVVRSLAEILSPTYVA